MGRKILALDLKEDLVSAILISSGIRGNVVEDFLEVPVEDTENRFKGALEQITAKMNTDGATCVVSIPADEFVYRNLTVPFNSPHKIRQILPFELDTLLSASIDDFNIDFIPVKRTDAANVTDILVCCVDKNRLLMYLASLSEFNLHPDSLTISGFPVAYSLSLHDDFPENGILLDMGRETAGLFVIVGRQVCMVRNLTIGSSVENKAIHLAQQIRHTLYGLEDIRRHQFQVEALVITGTGSKHTDFTAELCKHLGLSLRHMNLADVLGWRFKMEPGDSWNPNTMDSPLALGRMEVEGAGGFNFRRRSFLEKQFWSEHGKRVIQTGVLAVVVLMAGFIHLLLDTYLLEQKVARTNRDIAGVFQQTFPDVKRIVDPLHQMRVKIESLRNAAVPSGESRGRYFVIDVLNHISKQIPETIDIEITRLVIGPENTLLSGNTDNFNTVDDIKGRLENAAIFKSATISSANMDRSENRVRFKMKIDLADHDMPDK